MKFVMLVCLVVSLVWGAGCGVSLYSAEREFETHIGSHWDLADRASTLATKKEHIDKYVVALESAGLSGMHDTAFYPTPTNSFDENLKALKTLQGRLEEIQGMDVKSFEYQQALSQVTQQEMTEAGAMTAVFEGCWLLKNHTFLWGWHLVIIAVIIGLIASVGVICAIVEYS